MIVVPYFIFVIFAYLPVCYISDIAYLSFTQYWQAVEVSCFTGIINNNNIIIIVPSVV